MLPSCSVAISLQVILFNLKSAFNFWQLNEEAASLDWTKSTGHMLSGRKIFDSYEDEFVLEPGIAAAGHSLEESQVRWLVLVQCQGLLLINVY